MVGIAHHASRQFKICERAVSPAEVTLAARFQFRASDHLTDTQVVQIAILTGCAGSQNGADEQFPRQVDRPHECPEMQHKAVGGQPVTAQRAKEITKTMAQAGCAVSLAGNRSYRCQAARSADRAVRQITTGRPYVVYPSAAATNPQPIVNKDEARDKYPHVDRYRSNSDRNEADCRNLA